MNDTESLRAELQYIWSNGDYRQVVRKNSVPFSLDSNILHLTSPVHTFVDGLAGVEEVYKTWTLALTLLFLSSSSYCFNPFTYYFFSWLFIWLGLKMLKKKPVSKDHLFCCGCKLFQFPWISWARQKVKGKFSDQRCPSSHMVSVWTEDRRGWKRW